MDYFPILSWCMYLGMDVCIHSSSLLFPTNQANPKKRLHALVMATSSVGLLLSPAAAAAAAPASAPCSCCCCSCCCCLIFIRSAFSSRFICFLLLGPGGGCAASASASAFNRDGQVWRHRCSSSADQARGRMAKTRYEVWVRRSCSVRWIRRPCL
ncbi:hypothetical protein VTN02DRAFT_6498 [Thermoascus thermophilus]